MTQTADSRSDPSSEPALVTPPDPIGRKFESLVHRHQHSVWRYLRMLGCDARAADDLTQDTFLALFQSTGTQGQPSQVPRPIGRWLRGTAHNLAHAHWRKLRGRREFELTDLDSAELAWREYARDDFGASYRIALRACIAVLSRRQRTAVEMRYRVEPARRSEIAAAIGIREEGVKSLLRRVKRALRDCIQRKSDR